jgi:hypothetical protein
VTQRTSGDGAGATANDITVTVIGGALDVFEKDGRRVVRIIDVVMVAVDAALRLGLSGAEAERTAQHIQCELVECVGRNGVGIIDSEDGTMWLPATDRETE